MKWLMIMILNDNDNENNNENVMKNDEWRNINDDINVLIMK